MRPVPRCRDHWWCAFHGLDLARCPMTTQADYALAPEPRREGPMTYRSPSDVAAELGVSKMTVYRLVHDCELDHVRVGRLIKIPQASLDKYLKTGGSEAMGAGHRGITGSSPRRLYVCPRCRAESSTATTMIPTCHNGHIRVAMEFVER